MKRITAALLALALSTPAQAYDGLDVLDGGVAAADEIHVVIDENSAGWIFQIILDIAEATGPDLEAMQTDDPDAVDATFALIEKARSSEASIIKTHTYNDCIFLVVGYADGGAAPDGRLWADLQVEVVHDDDTVTPLTLRILSDGEEVIVWRTDTAMDRV